MDHENEQESQQELAAFSDRVVAFGFDMALFVGLYFLTLKLAFPKYTVFLNPHEGVWAAAWTGLFLLFQAYMSSEGRASPGKSLVGIRVASADGESLSIGQALVRAGAYIPSSILNLGFAWSLVHPARQCWHDMAVGSLVVETRRRSPLARAGIRATAGGILTLIGGLWYWNNVAQPRYQQIMEVGYAKVGLEEISNLQRIYHIKHGRYARELKQLAPLSGEPRAFLEDMSRLFDAQAGIKMDIDAKSYRVVAHATDSARTLVAVSGPPQLVAQR